MFPGAAGYFGTSKPASQQDSDYVVQAMRGFYVFWRIVRPSMLTTGNLFPLAANVVAA